MLSWLRSKTPPTSSSAMPAAGSSARANFGNTFVKILYRTLFPEIWNEDGLDTLEKIKLSNCFENGAFVFEDPHHQLFDLIYYNTNNAGGLGTLSGIKMTRGATRKPLSHLIPHRLVKKQGPNPGGQWNNITFIFYGESPVELSRHHLGEIKQYERIIVPPIRFLCNPQCETDPPPYCGRLNIGQKILGKSVIKFYSYSIKYQKGRQPIRLEGPFTYIKLESLPASPELDVTGSGRARHQTRWGTKMFAGRRDKNAAKRARKAGKCFIKGNSSYCYRAEDYGYVPDDQDSQWEKYDNVYNSFGRANNAEFMSQVYNYNAPIFPDNLEKYKLRIGQELFVPQILTETLIRQCLENETCNPLEDEPEHTVDAEEWVNTYTAEAGAAPPQPATTGGRRKLSRKTTRTKRKRRRKKSRRRKCK